jgi:hypothetical protein
VVGVGQLNNVHATVPRNVLGLAQLFKGLGGGKGGIM